MAENIQLNKEGVMRLRQLTLTGLCLILTVSVAMAKDKKHEKPMDQQAMMEVYQKLAQPGEPHKQFASLAGSWTTQTKEWMEPGKPPMEAAGTCDFKLWLGGRFLQQEFTSEMIGQPYNGIGISGYDNLRKRYVTTWIDTWSTGMFTMEGTASADGKTITLKGRHDEPGGGHMMHRAVWKIVDNNTQTFDMYGTHGHGGKEMKVMQIVYTRKPWCRGIDLDRPTCLTRDLTRLPKEASYATDDWNVGIGPDADRAQWL